jgi:hypothetical protein
VAPSYSLPGQEGGEEVCIEFCSWSIHSLMSTDTWLGVESVAGDILYHCVLCRNGLPCGPLLLCLGLVTLH